jgi:hypothetical protein
MVDLIEWKWDLPHLNSRDDIEEIEKPQLTLSSIWVFANVLPNG